MFENFAFDKRQRVVTGYHFPVENASAVMCLIHGIGEHAGRYLRMADKLAEKDIAVVSMDLRGHGISSGVRGDTAPRTEVLSDVDALIEYAQEFYPGRPVILYGHSMGGNLCLDYRARGAHNDIPTKYIVSAPWIKLVRPVPKALYRIVKGAAKVAPKMTISQNLPEENLGNPDYVRPYKKDPLVHAKVSLRCAVECFDFGNAIYNGVNTDNHRADDKPFLLMHGDTDKICDVSGSRQAAKRFAALPNFTYMEWEGYFHEIHNGGPGITGDKVIETIRDFITG
ncbi:MAG: alpha/beta fold hydrolase [Emergencia sp.]